MPTSTFYNLRTEKKQRIINAIKKEFERAPLSEMSVKNIVVDAKIARGSFYQYFESREDLIEYFLVEEINRDREVLSKFYKENNNDLFETVYKYVEMITERECENKEYYVHLIEYTREFELNSIIKFRPEDLFKSTIEGFDNIKDKDDFITLIKILSLITHFEKLSIFSGYENRNDGLKSFRKKLDFLKVAYETNKNT